jgi:hypothetical protein
MCLPLQPANEETGCFGRQTKKIKNKVCSNKKGSYLCSPKTMGHRKAEILKAIFSIKLKK